MDTQHLGHDSQQKEGERHRHEHHYHHDGQPHEHFSARVITVSDRSFKGVRTDGSGPALVDLLERAGFAVEPSARIVPDERELISAELQAAVADDIALVVTTGGTGFAQRDVTPEATLEVVSRRCPGIPEAMRAASLAITPHGCLSREEAGIAERTLIVNLPGSPKAAVENLQAVLPALSHGLALLRGDGPVDCAR